MATIIPDNNPYFQKVKPGEILLYDYRIPTPQLDGQKPLKLLQWNIERGYQFPKILKILKEIDADILCIQEVDIGCKRSGQIEQMEEICKELNLKGGFVCEFWELESPLRRKNDQGGGLHGNAIFTKFDAEFYPISHCYHPYEWIKDGEKLLEPRVGERYSMAGIIQPPNSPPILCYSVHLEVFCGIKGRILQFSDILKDSHRQLTKYPHQVIFGDLNTLGHSFARFSPSYCTDEFRWRSLGSSEAEWWHKHLFSWTPEFGNINQGLQSQGFTKELAESCVNPYFWDPWDLTEDYTLSAYFGLFKSKLDWTLIRQFILLDKAMGNHDFSASDHKYLLLTVKYSNDIYQRNLVPVHSQPPKSVFKTSLPYLIVMSLFLFKYYRFKL